jgi:hypothetical protein
MLVVKGAEKAPSKKIGCYSGGSRHAGYIAAENVAAQMKLELKKKSSSASS